MLKNTSEVPKKFHKLFNKAKAAYTLDEKVEIYKALMDNEVAAAYEEIALLAYQNRFWTAKRSAEVEIWLRKGIRREVAWCSLVLGWMFNEGIGVTKDPEEALEHYLKAARAGLSEGFFGLGKLLVSGVFDERAPEAAAPYFWEAVQRGHEKAKEYLRTMSAWHLVSPEAFSGEDDLLDSKRFLKKALGSDVLLNSKVAWTKDQLIEEANQGNAEALYQLGQFFLSGKNGFPLDEYKGANCLTAATERGSLAAQYELANLHILGRGVPKDYGKAKNLLEEAAAKGNTDAMNRLGDWYREGTEESPNWPLAIFWYQKGVEKKNLDAMLTLGICYLEGTGVEKNVERALILFRMMANEKSFVGMNWLGKTLLRQSDSNSSAEGLSWLRESARSGDPEGMYLLYVSYSEGLGGLARNDKEALAWLLFSARRGYGEAQKELGLRIARKNYRAPSGEEEFQWLQSAANAGDLPAINALGLLFLLGNSKIEADEEQAFSFFEKAANGGLADAQMNLSRLYLEGRQIEKRPDLAAFWEQKAFLNGNTEAYYLYGLRQWEEGNEEESIEKLTYAADYHFTPAAIKLGDIFKEQGRIDKARFWYEQALEFQDIPAEDILERLKTLA